MAYSFYAGLMGYCKFKTTISYYAILESQGDGMKFLRRAKKLKSVVKLYLLWHAISHCLACTFTYFLAFFMGRTYATIYIYDSL